MVNEHRSRKPLAEATGIVSVTRVPDNGWSTMAATQRSTSEQQATSAPVQVRRLTDVFSGNHCHALMWPG